MFGTYTYTSAAGRQLTPFEQRESDPQMGRLFAALSGALDWLPFRHSSKPVKVGARSGWPATPTRDC
jgi:hypothetical protein